MRTAFAAALMLASLMGCTTLDREHEVALNRVAGIEVRAVDEGVELRLPETVLFDFGESVLNGHATDAIKRTAVLLNRSARPIRIDGYTDNVGSLEYNRTLSRERAQAVADELAFQGVDGARISVRGLAYEHPIASNDTPEGRAQNRRTEVMLIGEALDTILGRQAPAH